MGEEEEEYRAFLALLAPCEDWKDAFLEEIENTVDVAVGADRVQELDAPKPFVSVATALGLPNDGASHSASQSALPSGLPAVLPCESYVPQRGGHNALLSFPKIRNGEFFVTLSQLCAFLLSERDACDMYPHKRPHYPREEGGDRRAEEGSATRGWFAYRLRLEIELAKQLCPWDKDAVACLEDFLRLLIRPRRTSPREDALARLQRVYALFVRTHCHLVEKTAESSFLASMWCDNVLLAVARSSGLRHKDSFVALENSPRVVKERGPTKARLPASDSRRGSIRKTKP